VTLPGTTAPPPAPSQPSSGDAQAEALRRLKDLRDQELITEEEYQEKRRAILDEI
jgi:hypothetical protein